MLASDLLEELKKRLTAACGDRLRGVVLFGSEARGEAGPDSDIDVLAVLETLTVTTATNWSGVWPRCIRSPCDSVVA